MADLWVIGGGPAGYAAALRAAALGARVTVVEEREAGGTCLNRGCIPTKAMIHVAHLYATMKRASSYGIRLPGEAALDYDGLVAYRERVVTGLRNGLLELLRQRGVLLVAGRGTLLGPGRLQVAGEEVSAERILLASGSENVIPDLPGRELPGVVDSDGLLAMGRRPERLVILGGGVVGMEFASLFADLGSRVTVLEALPAVLRSMDGELVRRLLVFLRRKGVEVLTGHLPAAIAEGSPLRVVASGPQGEVEREGDVVLLAMGRKVRTAAIGLEHIGLVPGEPVPVDPRMRTPVSGLWAAGDVTGPPFLAHTAMLQGERAAEDALGHDGVYQPRAIPFVVYTEPELAGCGLTEEGARAEGRAVRISRFPFGANGRAQGMDSPEGLVKLIADADSGRILGMHVLGAGASELIHEGVLAVELGLHARDLASVLHAHPTLSESIGEAARGLFGSMIHALERP